MLILWIQKEFLFFVLWIYLLCACTAKGEIWSLLFHCYSLRPTPLLLIFLITNYRWICSDDLKLKKPPFSVLQNFHIFNSFLLHVKIFNLTRIPSRAPFSSEAVGEQFACFI